MQTGGRAFFEFLTGRIAGVAENEAKKSPPTKPATAIERVCYAGDGSPTGSSTLGSLRS